MARKGNPKQSLDGDLLRTVVKKYPESEKSSPVGSNKEFFAEGYHTKPDGSTSNTKYGRNRKDFQFLKHTTGKVPM